MHFVVILHSGMIFPIKPLTRWRPRSVIPLAVSPAMTMIGIAAEDGLAAAAMSAAGPGALPMNVALGDLKVLESELLPVLLYV